MTAMKYLSSAALYVVILMVLYGKREAVPRKLFTAKKGDQFYNDFRKVLEDKKRDKGSKSHSFTQALQSAEDTLRAKK